MDFLNFCLYSHLDLIHNSFACVVEIIFSEDKKLQRIIERRFVDSLHHLIN